MPKFFHFKFPVGLTEYTYQRVCDEIKLQEKENEEIKECLKKDYMAA